MPDGTALPAVAARSAPPAPAPRMRILVVCSNYFPEVTGVGQMTTELAEQLVARGHAVTLATTFAFYPEWRWRERPPLRRVESLNGVFIRRFRMVLPRNRGALWRIICDTSFAASALPNSLGVPRPDCVLAISPPIQAGIAAAILARRWRAPLCLHLKDLPLEVAQSVGMMRRGRLLGLGLALERLAYRLADHIVPLDDAFLPNLAAQGVAASRVSVIPNWIDLEGRRPAASDPELRRMLGASAEDCLFLHTGNMGEKQDLLNVVAAAARLRDAGRFKFAFVGDGMQRRLVEAAVARHGLDNVRLLPLQPRDLYARILASADVLLLNQGADVIDSVVPHKLLSYMAAARPVLAAVNPSSLVARMITDAGAGVLRPPADPAALAQACRRLAASPGEREALGGAGRALVERRFDRRGLLDDWEDLLGRLVSRGRPGGGHRELVP